jgi:parallel beta-helix repeat protein
VRNNVVHDNRGGILVNNVRGGGNNLVYNNIVYDNELGIITYAGTGNMVVNNTVYHNTPNQGIAIGGSNNIVRNNIASNNSTNLSSSGSGHTFSNNLCSSSGTNCAIVENATSTFTDATNKSFTLRLSSQAIDRGFDLTNNVTSDALGISRPQGNAFDIGAYEYSAPAAGLNAPTNLQVSPQ